MFQDSNNVAILNIIVIDYSSIIFGIRKNETINIFKKFLSE